MIFYRNRLFEQVKCLQSGAHILPKWERDNKTVDLSLKQSKLNLSSEHQNKVILCVCVRARKLVVFVVVGRNGYGTQPP